jgi:Kef-type K+ transport system membrane component KefB
MNCFLAAAGSVLETERLVSFTLLQLLFILAAARLCGGLARRLGQPRVVGEIVGGLLLGPSLFGRLWPAQFEFVFHSTPALPLVILSQIGLTLLMFQIGLEFDFSHLRERKNRAAMISISAVGIAVPFALGWWLGDVSHAALAPEIQPLGYRLFLGVALAITAIPILGRIMMELGISRTRLGAIAITAAALDDVTGWTLLALVSALTVAQFSAPVFVLKVALLAVYFVFNLVVTRPLLRRWLDRYRFADGDLPHHVLAWVLGVIFVSGLITFSLGVFVIFGGFIIGVLLHDRPEFVAAWKKSVAPFVTVFFLPIFFTFTGLRTNVTALDSAALWGWCALVIGAATAGKFVGCTAAARWHGLSWAEAGCLGIMMNTRALMELIVINVGYELGVIPPSVFTMLVLMAIFSTVITSPCLRWWLGRMGHRTDLRPDV